MCKPLHPRPCLSPETKVVQTMRERINCIVRRATVICQRRPSASRKRLGLRGTNRGAAYRAWRRPRKPSFSTARIRGLRKPARSLQQSRRVAVGAAAGLQLGWRWHALRRQPRQRRSLGSRRRKVTAGGGGAGGEVGVGEAEAEGEGVDGGAKVESLTFNVFLNF